jgi:hypothetical protein
MLDTISGIDLHAIVIHPDRHADDQRSLWEFQSFTQIRIQAHQFRGFIELSDCQSECRRVEFMQGRHQRKSSPEGEIVGSSPIQGGIVVPG